jgi:hypothetical protein
MWDTDRFDQMLEALVGFELKHERGILAIMGKEIVQRVKKGEGCFHWKLLSQSSWIRFKRSADQSLSTEIIATPSKPIE